MGEEAYEVVAVGGGNRKRHRVFADATRDLNQRMRDKTVRPWQVKPFGAEEWGHERTVADVNRRLRALVKDANPGRGARIRGDQADDVRFIFRKTWIESAGRGSQVLRAAMSQLGVPYKWAWADPRGDGDGEAGFDCSGLVSWAYSQVGVYLPHYMVAIRAAGNVDYFTDRGKLKPGDIVMCDASDRPNPDHGGLYAGDGKIVDASSYYDEVMRRDLNTNPVLGFGRVAAVNGKL